MSKAVRYVDAAGGVDHDARRIEDLACAYPRPHPKGATAVPALSIFSRMGPRLFRSMGPLGPGPSRDRVQGWPGPAWPTAGRFYVGSAGDATPFFAGRGAGAKRQGPTRLVERELDAGP